MDAMFDSTVLGGIPFVLGDLALPGRALWLSSAESCAGKKNQFIEVSKYLRLILILPLLLSWAAVGTSYGVPIVTREGLAHHSTADLESHLAALDAELAHLANYSLRSSVGSIGFRSATHAKSDSTEWVQIELGQEQSFDQVVLVPSIRRDARFGFRADGFPVEFRIIAGSSRNPQGKVVGRPNNS